MLKLLAAAVLLVSPLVACGQPESQVSEEGVYGSSSGPNPNLADMQEEPAVDPANPADPAPPGEQMYPSQAAQTPPPPITGRSSAQTPATDGQN